jgi:hypothetical protein
MANEIFLSRPKTKPSSSTKGKLNEWDNGYKEFVPAGTRESNRTMLRQLGDSSFYKNEGKKESSYSLHLNVNGESQDPVAEMLDIFMHLTEEQRKSLPKLPEGSQGRMLLDNGEGLQIWLDSETGKVTIQAQLDCTPNIERQLLQVESQMNVCIARYRQDIINTNNK